MRGRNELSIKNRIKSISRSLRFLLFGTCGRTRLLISKSLDKKLSWREALCANTHLATCGSCRNYRHHLHVIQRLIRCYCSAHSDAGANWRLSADARERIKKVIQDKIHKPETKQLQVGPRRCSLRLRPVQHLAQQFPAVTTARMQPLACVPNILAV